MNAFFSSSILHVVWIMFFYSTSFCGFFKEQSSKSEDFVKRNKKGDIESLTGYAMEVLKKLQTGISYFGWVILCGSVFACASKSYIIKFVSWLFTKY